MQNTYLSDLTLCYTICIDHCVVKCNYDDDDDDDNDDDDGDDDDNDGDDDGDDDDDDETTKIEEHIKYHLFLVCNKELFEHIIFNFLCYFHLYNAASFGTFICIEFPVLVITGYTFIILGSIGLKSRFEISINLDFLRRMIWLWQIL